MLATLALMLALSGADQPPPPPHEKPKLVCRESEQLVGSHIRTGRRCKTAEEWEREDSERDRIPPTLRVISGQGDGVPTPQRPP